MRERMWITSSRVAPQENEYKLLSLQKNARDRSIFLQESLWDVFALFRLIYAPFGERHRGAAEDDSV